MAQIVTKKQSHARSAQLRSPRTSDALFGMATPKSVLKRQHLVAELLSSDEDGGESKDDEKDSPNFPTDPDFVEGSGGDNFVPQGRRSCKFSLTIDSDDSDELDIVLERLQTPKRHLRKRTSTPRYVIEVSSDSEGETVSPVLKPKTPLSRPRAASCTTRESPWTPADNQRVVRIPKTEVRRGKKRPEVPPLRRSPRLLLAGETAEEFLDSLSSDPQSCSPEVRRLRASFANRREELTEKLLRLYCHEVFYGKLSMEDVSVDWNVRLTCTAGLCHYGDRKREGRPRCRIELSTKVVDRPERLRDTLLHELCHAATWILHRQRGGHGGLFRFWADSAARRFPAIPSVTRCHNYKIEAPFLYRCQNCGGCIRRHSRSLDTQRKVCGRCGGRFVLLQRGPEKTLVGEAQLHRTAASAVR